MIAQVRAYYHPYRCPRGIGKMRVAELAALASQHASLAAHARVQPPPRSIVHLPDDVLADKILVHCGTKALCALARTCRTLRAHLVDPNGPQWRRVSRPHEHKKPGHIALSARGVACLCAARSCMACGRHCYGGPWIVWDKSLRICSRCSYTEFLRPHTLLTMYGQPAAAVRALRGLSPDFVATRFCGRPSRLLTGEVGDPRPHGAVYRVGYHAADVAEQWGCTRAELTERLRRGRARRLLFESTVNLRVEGIEGAWEQLVRLHPDEASPVWSDLAHMQAAILQLPMFMRRLEVAREAGAALCTRCLWALQPGYVFHEILKRRSRYQVVECASACLLQRCSLCYYHMPWGERSLMWESVSKVLDMPPNTAPRAAMDAWFDAALRASDPGPSVCGALAGFPY